MSSGWGSGVAGQGGPPWRLGRYKTSAAIHDLSGENQGVMMGSEEIEERVRLLLGPDGVARMAVALRCHSSRIRSGTAGVVIAVLELIEAARLGGIAEYELPARWRGELPTDDPSKLRERLDTVLGTPHLLPILSIALALSRDAARYRLRGLNVNGKAMPRGIAELAACLELLELLKSRSSPFPARWHPPRPAIHDGREVQARIKAILGPEGSAVFAHATGLTREYLSRVWAGERDSKGWRMHPSEEMRAIVELLEVIEREAIPRERWPQRWTPKRNAMRHSGARLSEVAPVEPSALAPV